MGKIDLGQVHSLKVGLPHHQMREIVSAKCTSHLNHQIQQVSCCITGAMVVSCTQGRKEALELLLKSLFPENDHKSLQKRQQNEAALTLPDILLGLCLEQGMSLKEQQCLGLDLLAHSVHEAIGHVFHDHILEDKAGFTCFDEISPP